MTGKAAKCNFFNCLGNAISPDLTVQFHPNKDGNAPLIMLMIMLDVCMQE
jgi:hypothetical protein